MFATTTEGGMTFAFPNACNTPTPAGPVPIPYPSIGDVSSANSGTCSSKVKIRNKPVVTTQSEISATHGDEAGTSGGLISGEHGGVCKWVKGSSKVNVEGNPATRHLDPIKTNGQNANAFGTQLA